MATSELTVESPIGRLRLVAEEGALVALYTEAQPGGAGARAGSAAPVDPANEPVLHAAREQLAAWFRGSLQGFDLPLRPHGTPFQLAVWQELCRIPYGETRTYGDLAVRLGRPSASRAVGAANGRNPLSIIVPCHRVIGASGALTGYAGGLARKRWLLDHE